MPVKKEDAARAVAALEQYQDRLTDSSEETIKDAVTRLGQVFSSDLFRALIDIQDYYGYVLEKGEPPKVELQNEEKSEDDRERGELDFGDVNEVQYLDIVLKRGTAGLGFSIAGGTDNPHFDNDSGIYITKIIPGGAAEADTRLKVYDSIVAVDDQAVEDVAHQVCVEALKAAGSEVKLRVKRFPIREYDASQLMNIVLHKEDKGLGFSIAGGVGNQHILNDNGIFVTKIIDGGAACQDSRLEVGDRITKVNNQSLENVTHEDAVIILKETSDVVSLVVVKPRQRKDGSGSGVKKSEGKRKQQTQSTSQSQRAGGVAELQASQSIDDDRHKRRIVLHRGPSGLGFNIMGGNRTQGIFVSYIAHGEPAAEEGRLKCGDKLLWVNDKDLSGVNHEEAVELIKKAKSPVKLVVKHDPEAYNFFKSNTSSVRERMLNTAGSTSSLTNLRATSKKSLYVRALFTYDKNTDSGLPSYGLSFKFGDILHVINASDDEWWQASLVNWDGTEEGRGIIPSKKRIERKEQSRLKSVKFRKVSSNEDGDRGVSLVAVKRNKSMNYVRRFPLFNRKGRSFNPEDEDDDDDKLEAINQTIVSYEPVIQKEVTVGRPIVLLGPGKDRISDDLLVELPDRITTCVPHTTRPPRPGEVHGQDYYFIESQEQMQTDIQNHVFIEAGQLNEHMYGTSVSAVKEVCRKGKHCLLDVSGYAIKRLQIAQLYPIAIFLKPRSPKSLLEQMKRMTADQARKAFERAQKTESEFSESFTTMVQGDTIDELLENVKAVINHETEPKIWIPSKEKI